MALSIEVQKIYLTDSLPAQADWHCLKIPGLTCYLSSTYTGRLQSILSRRDTSYLDVNESPTTVRRLVLTKNCILIINSTTSIYGFAVVCLVFRPSQLPQRRTFPDMICNFLLQNGAATVFTYLQIDELS